jgi:L-2-hydroxyglutarate oxidase
MKYDFTIVGAGIVGLSAAYKLSLKYPEKSILVIEKEDGVARHQTGRNSGVIHSGVYYKPGSYKARNCVNGRHQLVQFCQEFDVKHEICGKLIVAEKQEDIPILERIFERGQQNGIERMQLVGPERMREVEPEVAGVKAIHVGCTGIVDYRGMCEKLVEQIQKLGNEVRYNSELTGILETNDGVRLSVSNQEIHTENWINCGGLQCDLIAKMAGVEPGLQIVPFRGEYFMLKPHADHKVKTLIYPLPHKDFPFLGVHFTSMATGGVECGPNAVFAFKREGYEKIAFNLRDTIETLGYSGFWKLAFKHWRMGVDEYHRSLSKAAFVKGLQRLVPSIQENDLEEAPSGVRAMALLPDGNIMDDFYFKRQKRAIHVLNAPSPAATAALAIGDEIASRAEDWLLGA